MDTFHIKFHAFTSWCTIFSLIYWTNLAITFDKIIESYDEETKTIPKNFNEKKATCKFQNFYTLLAFLLITTELLIAVSIYYYLIKYLAKQKHLLPFHVTNNELNEIMY